MHRDDHCRYRKKKNKIESSELKFQLKSIHMCLNIKLTNSYDFLNSDSLR